MDSQNGDPVFIFRNRIVLTLFSVVFSVGPSIARERLNEVTFGFASGFGIKARFQNPSMPIPTYPGTASSVAGRSIYKYNDGYVDQAGDTGVILGKIQVDYTTRLGTGLTKMQANT